MTMGQRDYFLRTERIGFSRWAPGDEALAHALWGDGDTTRYLSAAGSFGDEQILARLQTELRNQRDFGVQYWPIFALEDGAFLGCCGLRPYSQSVDALELGFHLCSTHWGRGYGPEAARAVIAYAFDTLGVQALFAGHHPNNANSRKTLLRLGFAEGEAQFYAPTGLVHPSYWLRREDYLATMRAHRGMEEK